MAQTGDPPGARAGLKGPSSDLQPRKPDAVRRHLEMSLLEPSTLASRTTRNGRTDRPASGSTGRSPASEFSGGYGSPVPSRTDGVTRGIHRRIPDDSTDRHGKRAPKTHYGPRY